MVRAANLQIFGVDLAGEIASAFDGLLFAATLVKYTAGTRTAGSLASGTNPTTTSYTCQGFRDETAELGKRKPVVTLLGATILSGSDRVVPEPGDRVTIQGETHAIVEVEHDPAGATYTCTCAAAGPGIAP